jgi:hypothetical protein
MRLATREERRENLRNWRGGLIALIGAFIGVALAEHQWGILQFLGSLWPR